MQLIALLFILIFLVFLVGIVQLSFLLTIIDDNVPEENEVFQVVLETPNGGGSVGAQFRANVTIIDDDLYQLAPKLTYPLVDYVNITAGHPFQVPILARAATGNPMTTGGDRFLAILENDLNAFTSRDPAFRYQRSTNRVVCNETDTGNGTYIFQCPGIQQQGSFQLRIFHAFPQTIKGQYYRDGFFENLALTRMDQNVNFTWGHGRLMPRGNNYVSIRWTGAVRTNEPGLYYFKVNADDHARLWVNGELMLDHFHERAVDLESPFPIWLEGFTLYEIILEYREMNGDAYASLQWKSPLRNKFDVIPYDNLYSLFEIDQSPVSIRVFSAETVAETTECSGDGLYTVVALNPSYFQFCPRDIFGNLRDDDDEFYLKTQLFSSSFVLIDSQGYDGVGSERINPTLTYDSDSHCWNGYYVPERAGIYALNIMYQSLPDENATHVLGSPFIVEVAPDRSSGPLSDVHKLPSPLNLDAGSCANFTITMRDNARNLRLQGGDSIQVYAYRVAFNRETIGKLSSATAIPTFRPTFAPTFAISKEYESDAGYDIIRYGISSDLSNGNYSIQICPIIAGTYELHLLLKGKGISNQPFRILDTAVSINQPMGNGSYYGQYIADSPYRLNVRHTKASLMTSTVEGDGLVSATVAVTSSFMLTVRDAFDNVLVDNYLKPNVTIRLDKSPYAPVKVWDYKNGSYLLQYTPLLSGENILSVMIDGSQIYGSPYYIPTAVGITNASYSYAEGPGLVLGTTGKISYFTLYSYDIHRNRKTDYKDVYFFEVSGANNFTGYMQPCPFPRDPNHPICNEFDELPGYYWANFIPKYTGMIRINVYLVDPLNSQSIIEISNSPFHASISPSEPKAEFTDIFGVLYENIAGVPATISLQLRDYWRNELYSSGYDVECAILGVGVNWGRQQPWNDTQGLPSEYNYKGFFAGYPNFYGEVNDNQDGTYLIRHNVNVSGQYVIRLSLAEMGLNLTLFNDTKFGYLYNEDSYTKEYVNSLMGRPVNYGTTISWTGDIGGPASPDGDRGNSSYFERYYSKQVPIISVNATRGMSSFLKAMNSSLRYNFREEFWSARWKGMITPENAELYKFIIIKDMNSEVNLWIGGLGMETNQSYTGELIINSTATAGNTLIGYYSFHDIKHREFLLEFQHFYEDAFLEIYWESISTPKQLIPSTAFTHWRNMSHFNYTVYPTDLCSSCSIAWGRGLTTAQVGKAASFLVYAVDRYQNLIHEGGHVPTMVAVGKNGIAFRGKVTDYRNGTYLVQYYPTQSGIYRMYVTIGCCAPNSGVGYPNEIQQLKHLLVANAPFLLTIDPAPIDPTRSIATGNGLVGTDAGHPALFTIYYRDIFNNPTYVQSKQAQNGSFSLNDDGSPDSVNLKYLPLLQIYFYNVIKDTYYQPEVFHILNYTQWQVTYEYALLTAGTYRVHIQMSMDNGTTYQSIIGSPFQIIINPILADPSKAVCRGNGLRYGSTQQPSNFEIQLYDQYNNKLLTGGNRFFIRLYGDANFTKQSLPVIPTYSDTQNGRYVVSYQTKYASKHLLSVSLLTNNFSYPGGRGLMGYYYNTFDGAINNQHTLPDSNNNNTTSSSIPTTNFLYSQIDRKISFSWSAGYLFQLFSSYGLVQDNGQTDVQLLSSINSLRNTGQSIRWEGYLVAPRTDDFQVYAHVKNMNVTIFLDSEMIFDSATSVMKTTSMSLFTAYQIRVVAQVSRGVTENDEVSVDLRWSSWNIRDQVISQFFLYDSATPVQLSPFPVEVPSSP